MRLTGICPGDRFIVSRPANQDGQTIFNANASEFSLVAVVSARDMNTTGQAAPHRTPPKRQSAVYMMAFTVRLAASKFGNSSTSAAPAPATRFLTAASA